MVKSRVNGITTYYVGGLYHLQVDGATETEMKYYTGPTGRYAMRVEGVLYWIFSDHLQSSSVILEEDGDTDSRTTYTAFGEERKTVGSSPTDHEPKHGFGCVEFSLRENSSLNSVSCSFDFGLMYYVARWYDPYLNQFIQPDTIIPDPGNSGDWNRYAYVLYNPANFNDPSGHVPWYVPGWNRDYRIIQDGGTCGVVAAAVAVSMVMQLDEVITQEELQPLYLDTYIPIATVTIDGYEVVHLSLGVVAWEQQYVVNNFLDNEISSEWNGNTNRIDIISNLYTDPEKVMMVVFALPIDEGVGHWLVVIGYDPDTDEIMFFNPAYDAVQRESAIVNIYCGMWGSGCNNFDDLMNMSNAFMTSNNMVTVSRIQPKNPKNWIGGGGGDPMNPLIPALR